MARPEKIPVARLTPDAAHVTTAVNSTKLLSITLCLGLLGPATASFARPTFYVEAGTSHFALGHADLHHPSAGLAPVKVTLSETKSRWSPLLAVGAEFNSWFAARLSFQRLNNVTGSVVQEFAPEGSTRQYLATRSSEDVSVVTLSPEFRWKLAERLDAFVRADLAWVDSRGDVHVDTNLPHILVIPHTRRDDNEFTAGGSLGLDWHLSDTWSLAGSYQYVDLKPSFGRDAHVLSSALRYRF